MKLVRAIWYGVPYCVLLLFGGLVSLAADLTAWDWLERVELYLRGIAIELE